MKVILGSPRPDSGSGGVKKLEGFHQKVEPFLSHHNREKKSHTPHQTKIKYTPRYLYFCHSPESIRRAMIARWNRKPATANCRGEGRAKKEMKKRMKKNEMKFQSSGRFVDLITGSSGSSASRVYGDGRSLDKQQVCSWNRNPTNQRRRATLSHWDEYSPVPWRRGPREKGVGRSRRSIPALIP